MNEEFSEKAVEIFKRQQEQIQNQREQISQIFEYLHLNQKQLENAMEITKKMQEQINRLSVMEIDNRVTIQRLDKASKQLEKQIKGLSRAREAIQKI